MRQRVSLKGYKKKNTLNLIKMKYNSKICGTQQKQCLEEYL